MTPYYLRLAFPAQSEHRTANEKQQAARRFRNHDMAPARALRICKSYRADVTVTWYGIIFRIKVISNRRAKGVFSKVGEIASAIVLASHWLGI